MVGVGGAICLAFSQVKFSGRLSLRLTPRTYGQPPAFVVKVRAMNGRFSCLFAFVSL